jgi:hypothetical protein
MEFMDYQKGNLFKILVDFLTKEMVNEKSREDLRQHWQFRDFDRLKEGINVIFLKETGINLDLQVEGTSNAAVEAGWFNPGNVLNIPGIEEWFSSSQSSIGAAFKSLKTDILKGWIDTSTGKVGGDYSKIEFRLWVNAWVDQFLKQKVLDKWKCTMPEALATILIHEAGHVFSGFLHVHRTIVDPLVSTTAIKLIVGGKKYGKERVEVVKEAFKILEVSQKVEESDIINFSGEDFTVYFNKAIKTRDVRRTLSLGTQERSSEIYADLYSVRMGCPRSLVAGLASLPGLSMLAVLFMNFQLAVVIGVIGPTIPIGLALAGISFLLTPLIYLSSTLVGSNYDTPYRRIKTVLRDYIVQLNANTEIVKRDKIKFLEDAKAMEKIIEANKPFFESTGLQRLVGWMSDGSDFKAQQFEHFTDELLAHNLSLYKDTF